MARRAKTETRADVLVPEQSRARSYLPILAVAVALVPVVAAIVFALVHHWLPAGDDAVIAIRAHDVFSRHPPLVGMPSTLTVPGHDVVVAHPGPLLFWVLAIPDRLAGARPVGILVGAALINVFGILGSAWAARRVGGNGAGLAVLAVLAAECLALGRNALAEPWNATVALLPLSAVLFLTWAASLGDGAALVLCVAGASFIGQVHALYLPLAVVMTGIAIAGFVATRWSERRAETRGGGGWRPLGAAAVVGLLAWSGPLVDQVRNHPGNLVQLLRSFTTPQPTTGLAYGMDVVVRAIGVPPFWVRTPSGFVIHRTLGELPLITVVSAFAILCVLVFAAAWSIREHDRTTFAIAAVACAAVAVSWFSTGRLPPAVPDVPRYRLQPLWPVSAFAWFAAGWFVVRRVRPRPATRRVLATVVAVALVPISFAAAFRNPASTHFQPGPTPDTVDALRALVPQVLRKIDKRTHYAIRGVGVASGSELRYGILRDLLRRGYTVRAGRHDVYLGDAHAVRGDERFSIEVVDSPTYRLAPGATLIASTRLRSPATSDERSALRSALERDLRDVPARLTAEGRRRVGGLDAPERELLVRIRDGRVGARSLIDDPSFVVVLRAGLVVVRGFGWGDVARYQYERTAPAEVTVRVYVTPRQIATPPVRRASG